MPIDSRPALGWEMPDRTRFLFLMSRLLQFAEENKIPVACFYFYRTEAEQRTLFLAGKSEVAHSTHQDWLAKDLFVFDEDWEPIWEHTAGDGYSRLGAFWKTLDPRCRWGGDFRHKPSDPLGWDPYHFELAKPRGPLAPPLRA